MGTVVLSNRRSVGTFETLLQHCVVLWQALGVVEEDGTSALTEEGRTERHSSCDA